MIRKNILIILTILLTILLIAFVVWSYNKRIDNLEKKMQTNDAYSNETNERSALYTSNVYETKVFSVCIVKSSSTWGSFF